MTLYGKVVVIKRNGTDGAKYPLLTDTCLFGRSNDCDIRIQLPNVAKEHCRLNINKIGEIFLTNLTTENPTILNNTSLSAEKPVKLHHKDIFTIIDRSFRLEFPDGSPQCEEALEVVHTPSPKLPDKQLTSKSADNSPVKIATPKLKPPILSSKSSEIKRSPGRPSKSPEVQKRSPSAENGPFEHSNKISNKIEEKSGFKENCSDGNQGKRKSGISSEDIAPSAKRKRVSFGPELSPERFDKRLPPLTPIKKGSMPIRRLSALPVSVTPLSNLRKVRTSLPPYAIIPEESPTKSTSARSPTPKKSPKSKLSAKSSPITRINPLLSSPKDFKGPKSPIEKALISQSSSTKEVKISPQVNDGLSKNTPKRQGRKSFENKITSDKKEKDHEKNEEKLSPQNIFLQKQNISPENKNSPKSHQSPKADEKNSGILISARTSRTSPTIHTSKISSPKVISSKVTNTTPKGKSPKVTTPRNSKNASFGKQTKISDSASSLKVISSKVLRTTIKSPAKSPKNTTISPHQKSPIEKQISNLKSTSLQTVPKGGQPKIISPKSTNVSSPQKMSHNKQNSKVISSKVAHTISKNRSPKVISPKSNKKEVLTGRKSIDTLDSKISPTHNKKTPSPKVKTPITPLTSKTRKSQGKSVVLDKQKTPDLEPSAKDSSQKNIKDKIPGLLTKNEKGRLSHSKNSDVSPKGRKNIKEYAPSDLLDLRGSPDKETPIKKSRGRPSSKNLEIKTPTLSSESTGRKKVKTSISPLIKSAEIISTHKISSPVKENQRKSSRSPNIISVIGVTLSKDSVDIKSINIPRGRKSGLMTTPDFMSSSPVKKELKKSISKSFNVATGRSDEDSISPKRKKSITPIKGRPRKSIFESSNTVKSSKVELGLSENIEDKQNSIGFKRRKSSVRQALENTPQAKGSSKKNVRSSVVLKSLKAEEKLFGLIKESPVVENSKNTRGRKSHIISTPKIEPSSPIIGRGRKSNSGPSPKVSKSPKNLIIEKTLADESTKTSRGRKSGVPLTPGITQFSPSRGSPKLISSNRRHSLKGRLLKPKVHSPSDLHKKGGSKTPVSKLTPVIKTATSKVIQALVATPTAHLTSSQIGSTKIINKRTSNKGKRKGSFKTSGRAAKRPRLEGKNIEKIVSPTSPDENKAAALMTIHGAKFRKEKGKHFATSLHEKVEKRGKASSVIANILAKAKQKARGNKKLKQVSRNVGRSRNIKGYKRSAKKFKKSTLSTSSIKKRGRPFKGNKSSTTFTKKVASPSPDIFNKSSPANTDILAKTPISDQKSKKSATRQLSSSGISKLANTSEKIMSSKKRGRSSVLLNLNTSGKEVKRLQSPRSLKTKFTYIKKGVEITNEEVNISFSDSKPVQIPVHMNRRGRTVKASKTSPEINYVGVKELLKTPKSVDKINLSGIKRLLKTPKSTEIDFTGVRELLKTPKTSPRIDYRGIRELLKTPKVTPKTDLRVVRSLLKTPKSSKIDYRGIKELLKTPKQLSSPDLTGIGDLVKSPLNKSVNREEKVNEVFSKKENYESKNVKLLESSSINVKRTSTSKSPPSKKKSIQGSTKKNSLSVRNKSAILSSKKSTPLSAKKFTPISVEKISPLTVKKSTAESGKKSTPLSGKASTPVSTKKSTPVSRKAFTPVSTKKSTLVSKKTSTPVSTKKPTPVPKKASTPVSTKKSTSLSMKASTPVSGKKSTPILMNASTPLSTKKSTPVSMKASTPITMKKSTSVSGKTSTSVSTKKSTPLSVKAVISVSTKKFTPLSMKTSASAKKSTPVSLKKSPSVPVKKLNPTSAKKPTPVSVKKSTPVSMKKLSIPESPKESNLISMKKRTSDSAKKYAKSSLLTEFNSSPTLSPKTEARIMLSSSKKKIPVSGQKGKSVSDKKASTSKPLQTPSKLTSIKKSPARLTKRKLNLEITKVLNNVQIPKPIRKIPKKNIQIKNQEIENKINKKQSPIGKNINRKRKALDESSVVRKRRRITTTSEKDESSVETKSSLEMTSRKRISRISNNENRSTKVRKTGSLDIAASLVTKKTTVKKLKKGKPPAIKNLKKASKLSALTPIHEVQEDAPASVSKIKKSSVIRKKIVKGKKVKSVQIAEPEIQTPIRAKSSVVSALKKRKNQQYNILPEVSIVTPPFDKRGQKSIVSKKSVHLNEVTNIKRGNKHSVETKALSDKSLDISTIKQGRKSVIKVKTLSPIKTPHKSSRKYLAQTHMMSPVVAPRKGRKSLAPAKIEKKILENTKSPSPSIKKKVVTKTKLSKVASNNNKSRKNIKTPAKATKTPAKTTKTPAKTIKTSAKTNKTPTKSSKMPAKSSKTPAKTNKMPAKNSKASTKSLKKIVSKANKTRTKAIKTSKTTTSAKKTAKRTRRT